MSNTNEQEGLNDPIEFEEQYFYRVFNEMPDEVISDEQYDRNQILLNEISNSFFEHNTKAGNLPPKLARKVLELVFSNIQKHGYR